MRRPNQKDRHHVKIVILNIERFHWIMGIKSLKHKKSTTPTDRRMSIGHLLDLPLAILAHHCLDLQ